MQYAIYASISLNSHQALTDQIHTLKRNVWAALKRMNPETGSTQYMSFVNYITLTMK